MVILCDHVIFEVDLDGLPIGLLLSLYWGKGGGGGDAGYLLFANRIAFFT